MVLLNIVYGGERASLEFDLDTPSMAGKRNGALPLKNISQPLLVQWSKAVPTE